jgi:hypothetical protein
MMSSLAAECFSSGLVRHVQSRHFTRNRASGQLVDCVVLWITLKLVGKNWPRLRQILVQVVEIDEKKR